MTSLKGMRELSGSENGFGGDLRYGEATGLAGADKICTELAEKSFPGAGCKTWRAFIRQDLPNEFGVPNHDPDGTGIVDNHNTVTGTGMGGTLFSMDKAYTCQDWTSSVGTDGTPTIGFSWYGGAATFPGSAWYTSRITEGGCAPIINLTDAMDFSERGIGSRGGYGGIYCLALQP